MNNNIIIEFLNLNKLRLLNGNHVYNLLRLIMYEMLPIHIHELLLFAYSVFSIYYTQNLTGLSNIGCI